MRPALVSFLFAATFAFSACSGGGGEAAPTGSEATTVGELVDGRIAYTSYIDGGAEIYVMNADGSGRRALTDNDADEAAPVWAPDGSKIAFTRSRVNAGPSDSEIYEVSADGSGERKLTEEGDNWNPAWSPDGTKIAFVSNRGNTLGNVYVMNADGGGQTRLTESERFVSNGDPAWSPDGTKIAFTRSREGVVLKSRLYVMNADGSGVTMLSDNDGSDPVWSPDGTKIAFVSRRGAVGHIYVVTSDGTQEMRLTRTGASNTTPTWSPDGSKIAFVRESGMGGGAFYVMNADGSDARMLAEYPFVAGGLGWTPDSLTIVFSRCYVELDSRGYGYCDIAAINANGGELTTLIPKEGEAFDPAVSPQ